MKEPLMSNLELNVGLWHYDHARSLFDGTVAIDGVDATFESGRIVSDIFENMVRNRKYDVSELGLTFYLRSLELEEESPFIAIPVFPNRRFRHTAIYVNTNSGIKTPQDLVGKTIGEFATYGHDAGIWPKGILSDDYGVKPEQSKWVVGGVDWPMKPFDFIPFIHPENVDVTLAPDGQGLGPMLEAGEIDALISALVPRAYTNGSPNLARLFPNAEEIERAYFTRTGLYPIMHTVVVRRDLLAANPGLARRIFDAFCASRDVEMARLEHGLMDHHIDVTSPWFDHLYERNHALLGNDWWPYGVEANRENIDTFLRYTFEQGLSKRRLTVDEIFTPELLDT